MKKYIIQAIAENKEGKQRLAFGFSSECPQTAYECYLSWLSRNSVEGWEYYPFMDIPIDNRSLF